MKTMLIVVGVLVAVGLLVWVLAKGGKDGAEEWGNVPDGDRFGGGD